MKSTAVVISALFASVTAVRLGDYDLDNVNNALVTSNSDIDIDSRSESESDKEYQNYAQTQTANTRNIIDADGDGVEDNQKKTQSELDKFRDKVFGEDISEMHNTHNGELPGHVRAGEYPIPANYVAPAFKPDTLAAVKKVEKPAADAQLAEAPKSIDAETNLEVSAESLSTVAQGIEISDNYVDAEYLQMNLSTQGKNNFAFYINNINGPEDLDFLQVTKTRKAWKRRITDMDGDGVEDNVKFSHDELDNFYDPLVFGVAEDINNTHHGNLPGHMQMEFTLNQGEPPVHWQEIVQGPWPTS